MRHPIGDFSSRGVHPLTEDGLLFDGPRTTYGRFRVLHQIGAGSVGPVFRGDDPDTQRPVVIKVIRIGLTPERVAVVAAALTGLKDRLVEHPALATVLDTGVREVEPFIVSDFIEGDSLDVALREYGPAHMRDALPRLRSLADGLDTGAAMGIVHGSLHLRDIIVSPEQTVLTGLGVAAVLERVGVRPPVRRPYCAPEVANGHGVSAASDQFALAAIAHEWLSGRRIAGPGAEGFHIPALSPEGTEAMAAVFCRALDESPEARFPSATAFVAALSEIGDVAPPRVKAARRRPSVSEAPRLSFDQVPDDDPVPPAQRYLERVDPEDDIVAALEAGQPSIDRVDVPETLDEADADAVQPADVAFGTSRPADWRAEAGPVERDDSTAAAAESEPGDAEVVESGADGPGFVPAWWMWGVALVVAFALVLFGGKALVRWGAPAPAGQAAVVAPAVGSSATPTVALPPAVSSAAPPSLAPASPPPEPVRAAPSPRTVAPAPTGAPPRPPPKPPAVVPATPKSAPPSRRAVPAVRPAPTGAKEKVSPSAAGHEPPAIGRLLVRSTPAGAEVFLNGTRRGVTPLAVRDLPLGAYAVRVVRNGFAPLEQRVTLNAGRPSRAVELTLTAPPSRAPSAPTSPSSLLIESRPSGARVWVDGNDVGVTPVSVPNLSPGEHAVRVQRAGFLTINTTARVGPGAPGRLGVSLTSERPR